MDTASLITTLAEESAPTRPTAVVPWLFAALALGALVAGLNMIVWLGLQPLAPAMRASWFWMKGGYTLWLAGAGLAAVARLCRPGGVARYAPFVGLTAVAVLLAMAVNETASTAPEDIPGLWMGGSWTVCSLYIFLLAVPIFLAVVWVMRRFAPTRLAAAGAAAGALSGAVAAAVYGLHCPENTAAFVVVWYSLGIVASSAAGAVAGPRVLRW